MINRYFIYFEQYSNVILKSETRDEIPTVLKYETHG